MYELMLEALNTVRVLVHRCNKLKLLHPIWLKLGAVGSYSSLSSLWVRRSGSTLFSVKIRGVTRQWVRVCHSCLGVCHVLKYIWRSMPRSAHNMSIGLYMGTKGHFLAKIDVWWWERVSKDEIVCHTTKWEVWPMLAFINGPQCHHSSR